MIEHRHLRSICHASLGSDNLARAKAFYTPVLATLGISLVSEYDNAITYGKGYPEFWVQQAFDQKPASVGNGVHFGFVALSQQAVDDFYHQAIALGGRCNGAPGPRPAYGAPYYGCFIIDLDGHKIEASYWQQTEN
ncbi:Catechol 2,3-dioxygenase [Colwellia chukchiensis]|uniref:Catechol 2,3-dioxygenase n=1 Tax=Colwellia chukchiensis TaxID=641665 RepID=A0A1H7IZH3_9GAMM|nr:VOC family protein [Colwellia chukchiensis]SEK67090.1 Catechol 2,3-dioxygenase [Colwellia chukchiensis]